MNNNHLPQQSNFGVKSLSTLLPFAIAITLTNGLVFVMFYRTRRLRISSNYPLLSLAICDFLTGAINIPYFIVYSFQVVPPPQVGFWMYVLHTLMAVSAAYHILTITAEKYLAIITPLRHLQVTKKMMLKMLVGIWITSAFVAAIPIAWNQSNSRFIWYIIHAAVCLGFVFFVPYAFMIYAFTIMFRVIAKRERPSSSHRSKSRLQKKNINDRKCIIVFAIMSAIFAFCWLPYFTIMLVIYFNHYLKSDFSASIENAAEAFAIIRFMTSVSDPLLYTFFKRDFWLALRNLSLKREFRFQLESKSKQRSGSISSYLKRQPRSSDGNKILTLSENAGRPSMVRDTKTKFGEQIVYITSV